MTTESVPAATAEDIETPGPNGVYPLPDTLPFGYRTQMLILTKVVGPWRRRFSPFRNRRTVKVNGYDILDRLTEMPISMWAYDYDPGVMQIGPMSQDFADAFGLGKTRRMIPGVSAIGVSMLSIQALHRKVRKLEAQVAELTQRLEAIQHEVQN
jgi:hypothetical protein